MKVGLNVPKNIGGKVFPAGCVVDLFDSEALALIKSGEGSAVADGTMARKKAYGVPGCLPPAGFENKESDSMLRSLLGGAVQDAQKDNGATSDAFSRIALNIAQSEPKHDGTQTDKQKTNTLKK